MNISRYTVGLLAATICSAAVMAGSPSEPTIYAVNHQGVFPDFGDTLIRFHPDFPEEYETVGLMHVTNTAFGGLEFDSDGNLWAYASFNQFGGASAGLYSVNTMTAEMTVQGTLSTQTLNDLAWNPTDQTMYGVYTQGFATSRLYTVNLETGAVAAVGEFSGLDPQHNLIGAAIDSAGMVYVFDNMNNKIYISDDELNLTLLYDESVTQCDGCALAVGSQGIGIDWSRDDTGYHGAAGQGKFPVFYGTINTFAVDGSAYVWGSEFGPPLGEGPLFPPQVQAGDVAIAPAGKSVPGDLNGDELVNVSDLLILLSAWGDCPDAGGCPADLNGDDLVNVSDLLMLLSAWS